MIAYLNPAAMTFLPASPSTIRVWLKRQYAIYKAQVTAEFECALTKIHISADLWTSPNHKSILGLIAHYINKGGKLTHTVIAVRELEGQHKGKNQARLIEKVLKEFRIERNIGFFVGDNDSKNDTLCSGLSTCTFPLSSKKLVSVLCPTPNRLILTNMGY